MGLIFHADFIVCGHTRNLGASLSDVLDMLGKTFSPRYLCGSAAWLRPPVEPLLAAKAGSLLNLSRVA